MTIHLLIIGLICGLTTSRIAALMAGVIGVSQKLSLLLVVLYVTSTTIIFTLIFFLIFRWGNHFLSQHTKVIDWIMSHQKVKKIQSYIDRHAKLFTLFYRFVPGGMFAPVIMGLSDITIFRFFLFNIFGALIWAVVFIAIGAIGGQTVLHFLNSDGGTVFDIVIVAIVVLVALFIVIKELKKYYQHRQHKQR